MLLEGRDKEHCSSSTYINGQTEASGGSLACESETQFDTAFKAYSLITRRATIVISKNIKLNASLLVSYLVNKCVF